jgi:hypothetical protein
MADDAEPPTPAYGFKSPDFPRVNPERSPPPEPGRPADLPLPPLDRRAYDVKELAALAGAGRDQLGTNAPAEERNQVHDALDLNHQHAVAAGLFHVPRAPDLKRRRRWRNYILAMLATNGFFIPLAVMSGPTNPFLFTYSIAGSALCTSIITWQIWGLRTE